jgi:hypothetical protein
MYDHLTCFDYKTEERPFNFRKRAMENVPQIITTVLIILMSSAITKMDKTHRISRFNGEKSSILQRNVKNDIHQLQQDRVKIVTNGHDSRAFTRYHYSQPKFPRDHKDSTQLVRFLDTQEDIDQETPTKSLNGISRVRLHVQNTQKRLLERKAFLKTLNKLHHALLVHPFKTWKLKHKFSSMEDICVHEDTLHDAIENPRNGRLQHKLHKVLRGEDVFLDVFGGSNTVGAGLQKDEGDYEGRYANVIKHWWYKTITPITGSHLKLREIAIGGTSSDFFQFCFGSYIHEKLDLVFIELSINDNRIIPGNTNKSLPREQLTRQLLSYPTEPALVYINLFNGKNCTNLEDYGQDILTNTYKITSLKWRNAVCSKNARNCLKEPCHLFGSDRMHINQLGHGHISLMVINLLRKILLDHITSTKKSTRILHDNKGTGAPWRIESFTNNFLTGRTVAQQNSVLPSPVFLNKTTNIIMKPLCWTNLTSRYYRTDLVKSTLHVIIKHASGFHLETEIIGGKTNNKRPHRPDGYTSWIGKTVGAKMTLFFTIPGTNSSQGTENKTRSVAVARRTCRFCGAAHIWIDRDYHNKKFVDTNEQNVRTTVTMIALHVGQGDHIVNVEIARGGKVTILAIMVGPSDGPY